MDFKKYPSYKDSGVEWLGEVPEHFDNIKIKQLAISKLTYGANESAEQEIKEHPRYIRITDIKNDGTLNPESFKSLPPEIAEQYLLANNDILFARSGATVGKTFKYSDSWGVCCFAGYLIKLSVNVKIANPDYVFYYLNSHPYWEYIASNQSQSTIQNVSAEKYANFTIAIPKIFEQQQIVSFLDSETSRINNLIVKQEKLIEKLEEHRKSVISHTVTKGLDPNVPMKNSGVECLGEVPEHWKILQTRHLFNFGKGLTITKEDLSDEGVPCINYGEIHSKYGFEFNPSDNPLKCVSHDFIESNKSCLLNEGDFIFADTSEDLEGSGNFSYLNQKSLVFAGYHSIIARLKNQNNNARFFAYLFDSQAYRNQVRTEMKGVKVYSVSQGILKSRLAWLPPIEEQDQIVKLLDEKTSKIDILIVKQRELITKLKNYRTSIISHAVTGKIDVRDFVA